MVGDCDVSRIKDDKFGLSNDVLNFLACYQKLEASLKTCGFIQAGSEGKNVHASLNDFFEDQEFPELFWCKFKECELLKSPPKQISLTRCVKHEDRDFRSKSFEWRSKQSDVSSNKDLANAIRTLRNNAAHGGKSLSDPAADDGRDDRLANEAVEIVCEAAQQFEDVKGAFYSY